MNTTMDSSQVPLMVGQKWKDKNGATIELIDYVPSVNQFYGKRNGFYACLHDYQGRPKHLSGEFPDLVELIEPGPLFEAGQVWLRANGAKVTLFREQDGLRAYFVDEENPENKLGATVEWVKRDQSINLVKLLQPNKCVLSPKPPLGLRPRFIALGQRIEEINQAIDRYRQAEMFIPAEWLNEKGLILDELDRLSFDRWWDSEGSAMTPKVGEDREAHVHRISRIAWSNGFHTARHHETT